MQDISRAEVSIGTAWLHWYQAPCPICHFLQNLQKYALKIILLTMVARLLADDFVEYLTLVSHERHLRLFL